MKNHQLIIFFARLDDGREQKIDEIIDPSFLEIDEPELKFKKNIIARGRAYLANDYLIIQAKLEVYATLPCSICNELIEEKLNVEDFYHAEKISDIPSLQFDYSELLREMILIQIPQFVECSGGNCPERAALSSYLKQKAPAANTHFPFTNLKKI
jgi:DUF177 domain-containing protein